MKFYYKKRKTDEKGNKRKLVRVSEVLMCEDVD